MGTLWEVLDVPPHAKPPIATLSEEIPPPPDPALAVYQEEVAAWMTHLEALGRSRGTRALYRHCALALAEFLLQEERPLQLRRLRRVDLEHYLLAVRRLHPTTSTVVTHYNSLVQWFAYLKREGAIDESPLQELRVPQVMTRDPDVPSDDAVRALLKTVGGASYYDRRDQAIVRLLLATPLRRREIADLHVAHVNLTSRLLTVTVKGNRQRLVPFDVKAHQSLNRYLRLRRERDDQELPWLWLGKQGRLTAHGLYAMLVERGRQAGLQVHPHQFRHLFAHAWKASGRSDADLMRLGGWQSAEIMQRYGRVLADERAVEAYREWSPGSRFD